MFLSNEIYEMMYGIILSNLLVPNISDWNLVIENTINLTIIGVDLV